MQDVMKLPQNKICL